MRNLLTILFVSACIVSSSAQKRLSKSTTMVDESNMVFKHEWSIGGRLHTNGLSAYFERVWIKSIWKKNVLQTNFFYYRSFKDRKVKTIYTQYTNAAPYFYGKQNNFWSVNLLYGQKKVLAEKADQSGVRLCMVYLGGISLGILKPYGLEIVRKEDFSKNLPPTEIYFYDEDNETVFLEPLGNETHIYGAAGIPYGFNKIKPVVGAHLKFGFNFDWATRETFIKSIEVGTQVDIYYKKLPVYITERNKPYVFNFYVAMQLGKRW